MTEATAPPSYRLSHLDKLISNIAWLAVLLLSLRGILEFYGMKDKGPIETALIYITQPIVELFQFDFINNLQIPALPTFSAAVFILVFTKWLRLYIHRVDISFIRMQWVLALQTIAVAERQTITP